MEKKEYRSAIRSRKMIRQAFFELLKEKNFEKITVTDIVKKAEINRSTFYAHYPDVMGVVEEIQQEILTYTQQFMENVDFKDFYDNPKPHLQHIVKLVAENNELYRLLMTSAMAAKQLACLKYILIDRTIETLEMRNGSINKFEWEFSIRFYMGGIIDVYTQWMNGVIDCSLDDLTDQLANIIYQSTRNNMLE
jgi:AcrR family transcriptional regulator